MQRIFAAFVFLGALLLFALEPLAGRIVLPLFGSAFHVWSTTLLFFQCTLVLAYLYAHLVAPRIGAWHLALLTLGFVALPWTLAAAPPHSGDASVIPLLGYLTRITFLPFFALATTTVVAHAWWQRSAGNAPLSLYAISNAGSFVALLGYVLAIEPWVGVRTQTLGWIALYGVYLVVAVVAFSRSRRGATSQQAKAIAERGGPMEAPLPEAAPSVSVHGLWLALSFTTSALLYAVLNVITVDVGNLPMLWVLPLGAYLLSLVLAFAQRPMPRLLMRFWPLFAASGLLAFSLSGRMPALLLAAIHTCVLFVAAWVVHEALVSWRPHTQTITRYYLVQAIGGALGGAFVALVAPHLFTRLWEYPLALLLVLLTTFARKKTDAEKASSPWPFVVGAALVIALSFRIFTGVPRQGEHVIATTRSVYGVYRIVERETPLGVLRELISGDTTHGRQFVSGVHQREPLSYYARTGCLGDVMALLTTRDRPRGIGAVGLGAGAISSYLAPDEVLDVYEIDPADVALARAHFTYLESARGEVRVHVGDARTLLEAEGAEGPTFDLLLVDAFAGDAIPTHLLTREAIALDVERIRHDGIVLIHISSRLYALRPLLTRVASELQLGMRWKRREALDLPREQGVSLEDASLFVALFRPGNGWERRLLERGWQAPLESEREALLFTDDFSPIVRALAW